MRRSRKTNRGRFEERCHGNRNRRARVGSACHRRTIEILHIVNHKGVARGQHAG